MAARLKVYRTPIGFHDAYVAAPSRKAALAAWHSDADLFARGVAEVVTDPALAAEPLAKPGTVIKRLRGSAAEQIAAARPKRRAPKKAGEEARTAAPAGKRSSKPDRAPLDAAEHALGEAVERQEAQSAALAAEEQALAKRRRALEKSQQAEIAKLERRRDTAQERYHRALETWRG